METSGVIGNLHLLRPWWLLALLPLALLLVLLWRRARPAARWGGLVDAHLLRYLLVDSTSGHGWGGRRALLLLLAFGWLLATLALAGPVWKQLPQPLFSPTLRQIILLDLSPSMNASDVAPSRLARARFDVIDLLRATHEGQVALIAFGPEPFVVAPLTADARTILAQVPQLTTDLIPVPGPRRTALALTEAQAMLQRAGAGRGSVVLVTDGIDDSATALPIARKLAESGTTLSVLAVGGRDPVPIPDAHGGFERDAQGAILMSRPDRAMLQQLARSGGGRYVESRADGRDSQSLVAEPGLNDQELAETAAQADVWREEGPWLVLALLPLAALGFRRGWLVPVLAGVLVLPLRPANALGWNDLWSRADQQAAAQLAAGDAAGAVQHFHDPAWRAAAAWRAGQYQEALDALAGHDDGASNYNRGNALAQLGQFEAAIAAYQKALKQAGADRAATEHNLKLVRQLLEQQKQEQQEESRQQSAPDEDASEQPSGEPSAPGQDSHSETDERKAGENQSDATGSRNSQANPPSDGPSPSQSGQSQPGQPQPRSPHTGASANDTGQPSPADSAGASRDAADETGRDDSAEHKGSRTGGEASAGAGRAPTAADLLDSTNAEPVHHPVAHSDTLGADTTGPERREGARQAAASPGAGANHPDSESDPAEREWQQALEAQLRQVPDDPAGLLRQRFMLQHLRREGRLP